ncbi:MAG: terpene synthase family protein [Gammaproteobacteria bacterium]
MIPAVYCPFPAEVNPHFEAVHEHTLAWVRRFGLAKDGSAFERLRGSKFARLAACAYPGAPGDELAIVSDFFTWLFQLDDECDEAGIGKRPERLAALHDQCLEVLSGRPPEFLSKPSRPRSGRPDVPLVQALDELRGRMDSRMSKAWMDRFNMSVSEYFAALLWEARNREICQWPDALTYIRMRPYTGAVYIGFDLIELTERQSLPLVVRKHPDFQRLMEMASNVVCWCNDLFSLRKERAHGDMHNLAMVIQHQEGITLQAAVDRVAGLIERDVRGFMALVEALQSFGPETDDAIRCFVAGMRALMRGNLDWSAGSRRYQEVETMEVGPALPTAFA